HSRLSMSTQSFSWPRKVQSQIPLSGMISAPHGLVLEVNRELRYAFTRQGDDPSPHSRTLLRARTLSLAASALALYLYNQYVVAPDDAVVERDDMIDHMLAYKRPDDTDDVGYQRKMATAVQALEDASIIKPIKGTNRYIIYPVIASILTADRVEALHARYMALANGMAEPATQPEDGTGEVTGELRHG
ncbi:DUF4194 domain-containing protein, partial [Sphaerisporangium sp. NPDC051017]|uniref:DUF4194 domain-containing protein n=1 Tax=Sphaerisporangium sp. NPDC051017 TaxID=3154636 RepID=UPI003421047D